MKERKGNRRSPVSGKRRAQRSTADSIFAALVENAFDTVLIVDPKGMIFYANPSCEHMLGVRQTDLIGKMILDLIHPDDALQMKLALDSAAKMDAKEEHDSVLMEARFRHRDGWWPMFENILKSFDLPSGTGIVINSRDITERKFAEALRDGQSRIIEMIATNTPLEPVLESLLSMIESQAEGVRSAVVLLNDDGDQVRGSIAPSLPLAAIKAIDACSVIRGDGGDDAVRDRRLEVMVNDLTQDPAWAEYRELVEQHELRACWSTPVIGQAKNVLGLFNFYFRTVRRPTGIEKRLTEIAVRIASIAIDRDRSERRVRYMAHHDELTGLPNRVLLLEGLQQAMAVAARHKGLVALMFIDLDHFKVVNDSLGHHIGDMLLQMVAARLQHCLRKGDTVARLGGDEFVITLPAINHSREAEFVAGKALESLQLPFSVAGHELHIGASIGIGLYPDDGIDVDALMRSADTAMYYAKASGRSNFQFFTPKLNSAVQRRQTIANLLHAALQRNEFCLHYQPQVDIETNHIFSAEALLRWNAPGHKPVSPVEFIPIAEESGLILAIGEWVICQACMQLQKWHNAGYRNMKIAVNLSARQVLQVGFAKRLAGILQEFGISPSDLELEITESILMQPSLENMEPLMQLSQMGIQLSVDDFGTGYSSLVYLQRFPIHALKIDQSFVRGIGVENSNMAIISAIIAMASSLHMKVIAEGVETIEQANFLKDHGCPSAQGFYYGKPAPPEQFSDYWGVAERMEAKMLSEGGAQGGIG